MPVRSLNLSVFKWPDARLVDQAVRCWAKNIRQTHPEIAQVGYFGSYARRDWGVGSDLDLIIIVKDSSLPDGKKTIKPDLTELPVPTDLLVYTEQEWEMLKFKKTRFYQTVMQEAIWI